MSAEAIEIRFIFCIKKEQKGDLEYDIKFFKLIKISVIFLLMGIAFNIVGMNTS